MKCGIFLYYLEYNGKRLIAARLLSTRLYEYRFTNIYQHSNYIIYEISSATCSFKTQNLISLVFITFT